MSASLSLDDLRALLAIIVPDGDRRDTIELATPLVEMGIDSVAAIALRLEMEERYGVAFETEDLLEVSTASNLIALVNGRIDAGSK